MARILVIDDDRASRELVTSLLGRDVYHVSGATDGFEALEKVQREPPDLIVCDILMPSMDGFEFVQSLRGIDAVANTPVIFWTAHYRGRQARALAEKCGVNRILYKPCEPEAIFNAVADILGDPSPASVIEPGTSFDREHLRLVSDQLLQTQEQLTVSNQQLYALTRLNMQMASEQNPDQLLEHVCRGARKILGAHHAYLVAKDKFEETKLHFVQAGLQSRIANKLEMPKFKTLVSRCVLEEGKSARISVEDGLPEGVGLPTSFPRAHALLVAPVASLNKIYGWICLCDKVGDTGFNSDDEQMLDILGRQLGRIYENGRLYQDLKKSAAGLKRESEQRRRALERLQETELRFRQLAENIHQAFYLVDPIQRKVLYVSPGYDAIWGRSRHVLYYDRDAWLYACHPDDREMVKSSVRKMFSRGDFEIVFRILRPDKSVRWVRARGFAVRNDKGEVYRVAGIAEDVTEGKLAQDRIRRLNRVYRVLSSINTLIVRVKSRQKLFERVCSVAVEEGKFRMAWVGLVDKESGQVVPQAWAGHEGGYLAHIKASVSADHPDKWSATSRALLEKRPVVAQNIRSYRHDFSWLSEAIDRGYESVAALPLVVAGEVVGVFALYSGAPEFFDDQEMKLLTEMADDIAFALDVINRREKLEFLSSYDSLTGLPNRVLLHQHLSYLLENLLSDGLKLAMMVVDMRQFYQVNNAFGHHVGDAVLREFAARLKAISPDPANVGRMGDDSFGIIVPYEGNLSSLVLNIREEMMPTLGENFSVEGHDVQASFWTGIAIYPSDGTTAEALFANAEAAQKGAAASGTPMKFFEESMTEHIAEALLMEGRLQKALLEEQFVLHYQPKFDSVSKTISGLEALIRWQDPKAGLVPPGKFIPLLESTGLIIKVGKWAMKQALKDAEAWRKQGKEVPRIAVNVSPLQLRDSRFAESVEEVCKIQGLENCCLDLEITESLLMENVQENMVKLNAVHKHGVQIYIDDFGTGYSSLGYLGRFPVDALKIDRIFVDSMAEQRESMTIVTSIISLAHSLGIRVVAEGVETEEQAKLLTLLRCNELQGFLFGKPLPREKVTDFLRDKHP